MKKIAHTGNPEQDLYQTLVQHISRETVRAEADALFQGAAENRKKDRGALEKLFIQTPAAQVNTPNLLKESSALPEPEPIPLTANIDAFFEKLSAPDEAQQRYPELLKVAQQPAPNLKVRPKTTSAVRSDMSGGSA